MPPSQNAWTNRQLRNQCAWGSVGASSTTPKAPLKHVLEQPIRTLGDLEDKLAVKNTFIDVCLRDCDGSTIVQRRTLSVPPSFRSATSATASTVASSDFSDLCSDASDGYAPTFDSDWECSPDEQAVIKVSLQAFIPPTQSAARLSSSAKPWCPSGKTDTVPLAQLTQLSGQLATALEPAVRIVSIVASKMGQVFSSQVAVSQQTDGWSIAAMLKTEDSWQVKTLLEAAQEALIGASDTSQRILVVSCKPLATSEYGFRAMLGIVDDASKACWDVCSAKGCPRGSRCHWEHPRLVRRLDVGIHFQQLQPAQVAVPPE